MYMYTCTLLYMYNHQWTGFKIIGDNIDQNVHPSFQRLGSQTKSLHYFHSYALIDRIDFSNLSDASPVGKINIEETCLTSNAEIEQIKSHLVILVSR